MAKVLVTGATGFIGRHLVGHLLERGDEVRCLIHEKEARVPHTDCIRGDITIPATLAPAVQGVHVLYHLAGATVVASAHRYRPINSIGTRNIAEACARVTSPPTMVFLSSLAAAGPSPLQDPRTEQDPPRPVSEYGRSKLMAERYLRGVADRLAITVLRPPGVYGPGDTNVLPLFKAARWGLNFMAGSSAYRMAMIHVQDLVRALPQAAQSGRRLGRQHDSQGVYFVAGEEQPTLLELGNFAAQAVGRSRARPVIVPATVARGLGRVNELLARLTMQPLLLTSDKMREALAGSWICSSVKAHQEWNFDSRVGLAEGFRTTAEWYRQQHWL